MSRKWSPVPAGSISPRTTLRHCLTGTWETDFSDAIGALMADSVSRCWSPELCALIGWNPASLPPIVAPTAIVGGVTAAAAAATGLSPGTPVVCGANDTTTEFFGVGAIRPGMAAVKLATAAVLSLATHGPSVHPPISCYPHIVPGLYYTATGTNSCASAHRWLRDLMFSAGGFAEMDALAATIAPGADGLLFHPYLQGERAPYWDPLLRGDFIGLTISHNRAHFARALYEGIAFSIRDLLQAARRHGLAFGTLRLIGGRRPQRHLAAHHRRRQRPDRGAHRGRRRLLRRGAAGRHRHRPLRPARKTPSPAASGYWTGTNPMRRTTNATADCSRSTKTRRRR